MGAVIYRRQIVPIAVEYEKPQQALRLAEKPDIEALTNHIVDTIMHLFSTGNDSFDNTTGQWYMFVDGLGRFHLDGNEDFRAMQMQLTCHTPGAGAISVSFKGWQHG